jgi:hypothetical protein
VTSVERGGKRRLHTGSCPCDRLSRTEKYYGQPHRVVGFSRCLDAIRYQRCRPTASRPWHGNSNANGPVVGKLSSGSVSPRTYYICIMRLRMGSAAGDGQPPSLSTGAIIRIPWRGRSVPIASVSTWRGLAGGRARSAGSAGRGRASPPSGRSLCRCIGVARRRKGSRRGAAGRQNVRGEPIGVEALRVLPQRKIAVRHVGACGDRRVGTDAAPTRCRPRSPAGW